MISLSAVIEVRIPNHMFLFLQGCILFAQMDLLDGADLFEAIFDFKETEPLNENFAYYKIEDRNFIMNSGSYFVVQVILFASHFTMSFINIIAVKFARNKHARELGIWAYDDS